MLVLIFSLSSFAQNQKNNLDDAARVDAAQLKVLMERIGERVQKNLDSMFSIAFTESVRQQELKADASARGKPKDFVYESVVTNPRALAGGVGYQPIFTRTLKTINGKPVKHPLPTEDSKCEEMNPQSTYENPLGFLSPKNQSNYIFSYGGETDWEGHKAIVIQVGELPLAAPPTIIEKDNCFYLSRPLQMKGKVLVDSESYDVVQIQWRQAENFSAKIPKKMLKTGIISLVRPAVTINYDVQDFTVRFKQVKFQNPDQTLLLPYFSESALITRGVKLAGMHTTVNYTRYRVFNTTVKVGDSEEEPNR